MRTGCCMQLMNHANYEGMEVPHVLTNGNHKLIEEWQLKESLRRTLIRRPDMLEKLDMTDEMIVLLDEVKKEEGL